MGFQLVLLEELAAAGAPFGPLAGCLQVAESIIRHGSATLQREILPQVARGHATFWQGYSEPGAGSDLLALETRARLDGDHWVLDGRKIWSSHAGIATYGTVLARTDPRVHPQPRPQHADGRQPAARARGPADPEPHRAGLSLRGLHGCVRVPRDWVLGQPGRGLRPAPRRARHRPLLGPLLQGAVPPSHPGPAGRVRATPSGPTIAVARHRLAHAAIEIAALRALFHRAAWLIEQGEPATGPSLRRQGHGRRAGAARAVGSAWSCSAPTACSRAGSRGARLRGEIEHQYQTSLGHTLAGGTVRDPAHDHRGARPRPARRAARARLGEPAPVDLSFSPSQQLLQQSARAFLLQRCPPERVQELALDPRGFAADLWKEIATLGWPGLLIPPRPRRQRRHRSPTRSRSSRSWAARACRARSWRAPSSPPSAARPRAEGPARARPAAPLAMGERICTLALARGAARRSRASHCCAARTPDRPPALRPGRPRGDRRDRPGAGPAGPTALLLPMDRPGITAHPLDSMTGDKLFELVFAGRRDPRGRPARRARRGPGAARPRPARGRACPRAPRWRAPPSACSSSVVEHARARVQGGRPDRRPPGHPARVRRPRTATSRARGWLTWRPEWTARKRPAGRRRRGRHRQGLRAARRALRVARRGHQIMGAIGYSEEHPLHLFHKRILAAAPGRGRRGASTWRRSPDRSGWPTDRRHEGPRARSTGIATWPSRPSVAAAPRSGPRSGSPRWTASSTCSPRATPARSSACATHPRARIAPSDARGNVRGDVVGRAGARSSPSPAVIERAHAAMRAKYGWQTQAGRPVLPAHRPAPAPRLDRDRDLTGGLTANAPHRARTALWITCGWIGAALLVHWIVRRVPTHLARELTATATGAAIGLGQRVVRAAPDPAPRALADRRRSPPGSGPSSTSPCARSSSTS